MKKINNFIDVIKKEEVSVSLKRVKQYHRSLKRIVDCGRWAP